MSKQITYLIGAGASANTIPVVGQLRERITDIRNYLEFFVNAANLSVLDSRRYDKLPTILKSGSPILSEIMEDLAWLSEEAGNYYSIDTLAKKFYLSGSNIQYERLKKCLIIYLTIEQLIVIPEYIETGFKKNALDKRYDSFIASIGTRNESELQLNNNINILSWNYDLQFELSLRRFTAKKISEIKKQFQIFPLLHSDGEEQAEDNSFTIRKLNGSAIFSVDSFPDQVIYDNPGFKFSRHDNDQLLGLLLDQIRRFDFNNNTSCRYFNFAWEGDNFFENKFGGRKHFGYNNNLLEAEKIAEKTEILVVIGYSFPIFNREIDNRLMSKMEGRLEKVYIQDRDPSKIKSTMINAFKVLQNTKEVEKKTARVLSGFNDSYSRDILELPKVEIMEETNIDQFVIPYELTNQL
jgi:hypothetical protein